MAEHGGSKAVARSFAWYQTAKTFAASTGRGAALARLADKVDHRLVLSFRSVANTVSSLSYAAFPSYTGFLVGRVMNDLGKSAFSPSWGALMARVSSFDRRRHAGVMSYVEMGEDAAGVVAPIVAGALAGWRGFTVMLLARAALAVAAEVYAFTVTHQWPSHAMPWMARPRRRRRHHRIRFNRCSSSPTGGCGG